MQFVAPTAHIPTNNARREGFVRPSTPKVPTNIEEETKDFRSKQHTPNTQTFFKRKKGGKKKTRKVGKKRKGRKWSAKYKRSINCKKPKGFSQKQYCKYGRKKGRKTRGRNRRS